MSKSFNARFTIFKSGLLLVLIIFMIILGPNLFGQQQDREGPLSDKMNEIVDNVEEIRSMVRDIVVTIGNEGVPGFDKILAAIDNETGPIQNTRTRINTLVDLLEDNTFPFPSIMNTNPFTILVDSQGVFNNGWGINFPSLHGTYPGFPTPFPNVADKIASFLSLIDQPIARLKDELLEFDTELESSLAKAKLKAGYKYYTPFDDSLYADYFYPQFIRDWLGNPWVGLGSALVKERKELLQKKFRAISQQDIAIVGEGGNLSFIMVALSHLFSIWDLIDVIIQDVSSNSTGAEVTASYYRIDHLNTDIEIAQDSINSHIVDFQIWKALSLRTRIEINLSGHGDHPHPIAIFQLPSQFGGYLELARDIVQETITNMQSAGENVYQAQMFFDRGNEEFLAGHYKRAFNWYSKSYTESTK
jgi:hypothetical protein